MDASTGTDASTADVPPDGNVVTDAVDDAGCPDVFGTYNIGKVSGACGDLNDKAPQEIRGTTQACFVHFISAVDGGSEGINGGATLGVDGTFSGATLIEGTAMRSPCDGTWDAKKDRMTVVCGGASDLCTVELHRTGP